MRDNLMRWLVCLALLGSAWGRMASAQEATPEPAPPVPAAPGAPTIALEVEVTGTAGSAAANLKAALIKGARRALDAAGWRTVLPATPGAPAAVPVQRRMTIRAQATLTTRQATIDDQRRGTTAMRSWDEADLLITVDHGELIPPLTIRHRLSATDARDMTHRLRELDTLIANALAPLYPPRLLARAPAQTDDVRTLPLIAGAAPPAAGSLVRIRYGTDEASGFAEVRPSSVADPRRRARALDLHVFDWPVPSSPASRAAPLWIEPIDGFGLRLAAGIGFAIIRNDSFPLDGYIVPASNGGVALSVQIGFDIGARLFGGAGIIAEVAFHFSQAPPIKAGILELAVRGDLWLTSRLSITPGLAFGVGLSELSHVSLASIFGSTRTKARENLVTITPGVEVAWRLLPMLAVQLQLTWRFAILPDGHDMFRTQGVLAEVPGANLDAGGFGMQAGLRLFF
ncbi:MAG: hypothetical protein AB7S36_01095 [Planctomycetota bacterium]